MKRREWTAKQKLQIVLDGLKNQISVSDLCSKYSVTQGQYYKWRDQLLNNAEKAFETNPDKALVEAKKENHRLKSIIGTLTVELKKTELELLWNVQEVNVESCLISLY